MHTRQNDLRADGGHALDGLDESGRVAAHEADLRHDARLRLAVEQGVGFVEIDAHRLFDKRVPAGPHRVERDLGVIDMRI